MEINGEPWLVGKDVAAALGHSDTDKAIRDHVDSEDKKVLTRQNSGFDGRLANAAFEQRYFVNVFLGNAQPGGSVLANRPALGKG